MTDLMGEQSRPRPRPQSHCLVLSLSSLAQFPSPNALADRNLRPDHSFQPALSVSVCSSPAADLNLFLLPTVPTIRFSLLLLLILRLTVP